MARLLGRAAARLLGRAATRPGSPFWQGLCLPRPSPLISSAAVLWLRYSRRFSPRCRTTHRVSGVVDGASEASLRRLRPSKRERSARAERLVKV
eukprot:8740952-Pyramimonas_sp.AAC.1